MNKITPLLLFSVIALLGSCSEYVILPQYVSVEKLNALEAGMSKEAVSVSLSVDPYDAFHSTENGCELYSYKYLHRFQEINPQNLNEKGALRNNIIVYDDESDAFLYFEDGKLKDLIVTDAKVDHKFVSNLITTCNGPVSGCTSMDALNYNTSAIIDDGTCRYCPCDYYKNPNYDPNNECEEECITSVTETEATQKDECSICDLIKGADGSVNISVSTVAPWETSQNVSNNNNIVSNRNNTSVPQGDGNVKSDSKKQAKSSNKLAKLEELLKKSQAKDAKTGIESKRTLLLKNSIEKL
jgi:hypothetical protein